VPGLLKLSGVVFGRLTVLSLAGRNKHRCSTWNVICECGSRLVVDGPSLTSGNSTSCGCKRSEHCRSMHAIGVRASAVSKASRAIKRAALIEASGAKHCTNTACKMINPQPLAKFSRRMGKALTYLSRCKDCCRWQERASTYGVNEETLRELLTKQGSMCANRECKRRLSGGRDTCIDHDHSTGAVRGALCQMCNQALGRLSDSPSVIRGLLAYAERHRQLRAV
jgi:hypothetical protein